MTDEEQQADSMLPEQWATPQPLKEGDEESQTCVQSQELILIAARNCRYALDLLSSMDGPDNCHLVTALKKYVEDSCEAIKQIDDLLKNKGTSLETILVEIPGKSKDGRMSWRSIVGLRDVLAHNLLTLDTVRFFQEASQHCAPLYDLLVRVYFNPIKSNTTTESLVGPLIKTEAMMKLAPYGDDEEQVPEIAKTLVCICEDRSGDFLFFRVGRTANPKQILLWGPPGSGWKVTNVIGVRYSRDDVHE